MSLESDLDFSDFIVFNTVTVISGGNGRGDVFGMRNTASEKSNCCIIPNKPVTIETLIVIRRIKS